MLIAVAPMFAWDIVRERRIHSAYLVWLSVCVPAAVGVYALWDTSLWHATAPQLMGV